MANYAGYNAALLIGTNKVAGLNDVGFKSKPDLQDITSFNSAGNKESLPTLISATIDGKGNLDASDTNGQLAIINAFFNRTKLSGVTWTRDGSVGYKFDGYVSALDIGATVAGVVSISFTIESSGPVTPTV